MQGVESPRHRNPRGVRDRLAADNLALVGWVLSRAAPRLPPQERDDAFQAGCLGLLRAAGLFDLSRGTSFTTLAERWIRLAVREHLSARPWLAVRAPRGRGGVPFAVVGLPGVALADPRGGESARDDAEESARVSALVRRAVAALPPRVRELATLVRLEGLSCAEVGRMQGVTRSAVQGRLRRVDALLRAELERAGLGP